MSSLPTPVANISYRTKVLNLERELLVLPQLDLPVTHYYTTNGLYGRALFIPRGATITGKIHKQPHISVLLEGELSILLEDGVRRISAPEVVVSPEGVKRAAYAHKDSVWLCIHKTEYTELKDIEQELIANSYEEYLEYTEALKLQEIKS